jgi:hypothetical protein
MGVQVPKIISTNDFSVFMEWNFKVPIMKWFPQAVQECFGASKTILSFFYNIFK